jgi:Pyridoxamine 5'-phosphate oxidase
MVSWGEFEGAEPEFAARVRRLLDAHKVKILATLRSDGSPRTSGVELDFADGELVFGSMPGARKGADLRRDPRFALHSAPLDWSAEPDSGDAKIAGRAVSTGPLAGEVEGEGFRVDLTEVVVTSLNEAGTMLRVDSWRPDRGLRRIERA